jgi:hypothetical protein
VVGGSDRRRGRRRLPTMVEVGGGGGSGRREVRVRCCRVGRAGEPWAERPAARSPPAGVVVEATDLRVRVSGFGVRVRGSPCPADLEGGSRRTGGGGGSAGVGGEAAGR